MNLTPFEKKRKEFILNALSRGNTIKFTNGSIIKLVNEWKEDNTPGQSGHETSDLWAYESNGVTNWLCWWNSAYEVEEIQKQ